MSADQILVKTETRTDFLGEYVAYTYGDGHVETDPPDRPVTKEDYQRKRALQLAQKGASAAIASARIASATGRSHLNREQTLAARTASTLDDVRTTLSVITTLVQATAIPAPALAELVQTVDVGGTLVDPTKPTDDSALRPLTDTTLRELR